MRRDFNEWLGKFKDTVYGYDYYVDFEKVYRNIDEIKVELNILNSLIGSTNIESDFDKLVKEYPQVVKALPILIAVRLRDIPKGFNVVDDKVVKTIDFSGKSSIEEYKRYMKASGLFDLISKHIVKDLVDYVTGVEVGLDSNGRKNRGGHAMEDLVEEFIKETRCKYWKEMYASDVEKQLGIDLSNLSNDGKAEKRFDFVVESKGHVFGIEVNFYSSGGSKLNETARSFKMLAEESKSIKNFTFVWITDGPGWKSARHNLEETFDATEDVFCINELELGILHDIFYGN